MDIGLYREGFLNKAGKGIIQTHLHSWRPRFFILDGTNLKYYKSKEISPENMLGSIHLAEVESVGFMKGDQKKCFQITTKPPKSRTYYMSGRSEDEVMGWIRAIEMGKAQMEKRAETEDIPATFSISVSTQPTQSLMGPTKPEHVVVPSAYSLLGPATPPSSPTSSCPGVPSNDAHNTPIRSEYIFIKACPENTENSDEHTLNKNPQLSREESGEESGEDSTYESVFATKGSEASRKPSVKKEDPINDEPNLEIGFYDSIDVVPKKNSTSETPPPLPKRDPSLSLDTNDELIPGDEVNMVADTDPFCDSNPIGIYDEVNLTPSKGETPEVNKTEVQEVDSGELQDEAKPVYAKPMKKTNSKRRIPGMMDIGEVSKDVEEETSGGKESLKKGMTVPIGERFAVDELREVLGKYNEEENNNLNGRSEAKVVDFEVNEGETAFDVLKRFLNS